MLQCRVFSNLGSRVILFHFTYIYQSNTAHCILLHINDPVYFKKIIIVMVTLIMFLKEYTMFDDIIAMDIIFWHYVLGHVI